MQFPNVDPIPIPAPVWLMKTLGLLTLSLHFFAVQVLIGSLIAVIYFSMRAGKSSNFLTAASVVAKRLPVVMTYVINLGVPPLLFAQVLYGRALYTSSVLIGASWISVIFLVMGCYWLLYKTTDWAALGKPAYWPAAGALILAATVGHIYSTNMTLMLRPEVWQAMYAKTATGTGLPPHDPTTTPRLLFILSGGLVVGGLWLTMLGNLSTIESGIKDVLRRTGGPTATLGVLCQLGLGYLVYANQPGSVQQGLNASMVYTVSAGVWGLGSVLVLLLGLVLGIRKTSSIPLSAAAAVSAFLGIAGAVVYRDGIRDVTLYGKGFNVWDRTEVSNWGVIVLFLLLFVIGLGVIGWLLSVVHKADKNSEMVKI